MKDKFRELMGSDNTNVREKLFVIICLEGIAAALVCLVESLFINAGMGTYAVIISTLIIIPAGLMTVLRYGGQEMPITIVTIWMNFVVFPMVFFSCGGVHSGSSCWLALGFIYVFLIYRGGLLAFYASATAAVDIACYVIAYLHPEYVKPLGSELGVYVDSAFGIFSVGITAGLIFTFRRKGYQRESETAIYQRNELDRLTVSRERFYANFSHEIRNPINSIVGLNELNIRQTEDPEILKNSRAIGRSGRLLLGIVNDIMDLSQIENKSMQIAEAPYSSATLLSELVELVDARARAKGLELIMEVDPTLPETLIGDERRIVQVLLNLLTNAVKYTDEGHVRLTVTCVKRDDTHVRLKAVVADTGMGIERENLEHLFETYSQFDRISNSNKEGNGLGLPIAYELTKLMGGDIAVDSVYGSGSTFTVELDQIYVGDDTVKGSTYDELAQTAADEAEYVRSFEAGGARVLVVDDDEQNRSIISGLLKDTRVTVDEAASGEAALKLTAANEYHVILIDYVMPGMSGTETLEAIKTQSGGQCRKSVMIALTGATLDGMVHSKAMYDFDMVLAKPVEYTVLENAIADSLPPELIEYRNKPAKAETGSLTLAAPKKKRRIRITTDSICDLPTDTINEYDIGIMYMHIRTDKGRFTDILEIDTSDMMGRLTDSSSELYPDGSTVKEYEDFFKSELENSEEIIHLSFSSGMGETCSRAMEAGQSFDHVHVIDSGQISAGLGLLAMIASGWVAAGAGVEEICRDAVSISRRIELCYVLPRTAIYAGYGRISRKRAEIYDSLKIHPAIRISGGELRQIRAYRGDMDKVIPRHIRTTMAIGGRIDYRAPVIVTHVALPPRAQNQIMQEMRQHIPAKSLMLTKSSVSSAANVGVGAVGIAYLRQGVERGTRDINVYKQIL